MDGDVAPYPVAYFKEEVNSWIDTSLSEFS